MLPETFINLYLGTDSSAPRGALDMESTELWKMQESEPISVQGERLEQLQQAIDHEVNRQKVEGCLAAIRRGRRHHKVQQWPTWYDRTVPI
jgi:hypothetical protein